MQNPLRWASFFGQQRWGRCSLRITFAKDGWLCLIGVVCADRWRNHWPSASPLPNGERIMDLAFSMFGVDWVMPRTVMGLLFCWPQLSKRAVGSIWCMIPHCIMWSLWRERNARCFEGCEKTIHDLKKLFLYTLGMGCCCRNSFLLFSARFY